MQTFTQVQTPNEIQTPAPTPAPAPKAAPTFTLLGSDGQPQTLQPPTTSAELNALRARREAISDQLESVTDRRTELVQELSTTSVAAARPGLEARIQLLDKRILQLENDLATTGAQLSAVPASLLATTEAEAASRNPPNEESFDEGMAAGAFTAVFFMSILLVVLRRRWKKYAGAPRAAQLGTDASQRLERLEHGVDAIALEMERVSEGQRFVTKILSESRGAVPAQQRAGQPAVFQSTDPSKS